MTPIVKILVSCPNPAHIDACTLVFDTLRVGFPTARVDVSLNAVPLEIRTEVEVRADKAVGQNGAVWYRSAPVHHGEWIKQHIEVHGENPAPLVILDADTIFWKSVEDWNFNSLLAGYYVPRMWNDFAKCMSLDRIHTSFMWFNDVPRLRKLLNDCYPPAIEACGEYCPCDPFLPAVRFHAGKPIFWDTCCNLYQMIGAENCERFGPAHLEAFEHLNSASFFDVMKERLPNPQGFDFVHRNLASHAPHLLRGQLWPITDAYYRTKALAVGNYAL